MKALQKRLDEDDMVEDPNLPSVKMRLKKRKMFRKIFK
jgi:hypothetical protein